MKTASLLSSSRIFPTAAVMLYLAAGSALAQTTRNYTGASKSNGDSWNTASNWSGSAVPSGTDNVTIPTNIYVTADTNTPSYTGNLSIGTGATLQCGYGGSAGLTYMNALGSAASTVITMGDGATILLRGAYSPSLPAVVLNGNVTLILGASTSGNPTPISTKGITGAYGLTLKGKGGASITFNTTANTFSSLSTGHEYGSGFTINANVAGALGTGDVTIRAASDGTIGANLVLGAANAMASTATLSLYGPASATKLKVTAANSVKRLVVDGVAQAPGVYGKTGSGAQFPVSWIDSTSTNTLTVTGAPSLYWDLDDSTAGAGSTAGDASGTWDGSNKWNNAAGDGTAAAWTAGQQAVFSAGTDATAVSAVAVDGTQDIGGLRFEEGTVTLSGGGLRMTSDSEVNVGSTLSATISTPISNDATARQLVKTGAGTLTLSGSNSYTGITRIEQGVLSVASLAAAANNSPIGSFPTAGAGGLILGGGTFQYTGGSASVNRGFSVAGSGGIDISTAGTALTMGDVESINQPSILTVTGGTGSSLTIGRARIVEAAQLTLNPTTASMTVGTVNGFTSYASSSQITLGGTATGNVVTGAISVTNPPGSGFTQGINLIKSGSGDWKLNGSSTYGGTTTVNAGNLIAGTNAPSGANGAFGNASSEVSLGVAGSNNAAGILTSGAFTVARIIRNATSNSTDAGSRVLTLGGNSAHNSIFSGAIHLGTASQTSKGITLTAATSGQVTFSGAIQNPTGQDATEAAAAYALTAVTKVGPGTVVLSSSGNAYTGATLVSEGTLSLGNGTTNSNLYDLSTVSVTSGAVLNLNFTGIDTIGFLNLGGSPAAAGKWGRIGSIAALGADYESALITGNGLLNVGGGYLWDGGSINIATNGNGVGTEASGTWDATIQNWDRGITAHTAWGNTGSESAIFSGSANAVYTVTVGTTINLRDLTFDTVGASTTSGARYTISGGSLNFSSGGVIRANANQHNQTITSTITGSPAVEIKDAGNTYEGLKFEPATGATQTLGVITNPIDSPTGTSDKGGVYLGGSTTGNTVASIGYAPTGNSWYGTVYKTGTSTWTVSGTVATGTLNISGGRAIINGNTTLMYSGLLMSGTGVLGGSTTIFKNDRRSTNDFVSGTGIAPGNGVGTLTFDWGTNGTPTSAQWLTAFRAGSNYEWQVGASATDVVHVVDGNLIVEGFTLKIIDAGGTPANGTVQLPVFTYGTLNSKTLNLAAVQFDTTDLVGKGWTIGTLALTDNGSGTIYLTGLSKTAGYTVTYDGNGGTGAPVDVNSPYASGATVTVLGSGSLVKTGYVFTGWNTQADGSGTPYNAGATFTITSNVTLHAVWKTAYEIWLAANGATASDANFLSFAFGSDAPGLTGSASYDAGPPAVVTPGQPTTTLTTGDPIDFRAVFSRRSDYATAGLAYTLQFSADLNFGDGFREDVPVAAPNGGTIKLLGTDTVDGVSVDIMSVSYPWLIPVGAEFKKPTFFRVKVNSTSSSGQTPP